MRRSLDEVLEVLILHATYASLLYKHGLLDAEIDVGLQILRKHNALAHHVFRRMDHTQRCSRGQDVDDEPHAFVSTLQHHLPYEMFEGVRSTGCPLLNSSQATEAHHAFIKDLLAKSFRGLNMKDQIGNVLTRFSHQLFVRLHDEREKQQVSLQPPSFLSEGNDLLVRGTGDATWLCRVWKIVDEEHFVPRWYDRCRGGEGASLVRSIQGSSRFFKVFRLLPATENEPMSSRCIECPASTIALHTLDKDADRDLYLLNPADFGLSPLVTRNNDVDISLLSLS